MKRDGGWIELVDPATQRVRARAHLLVSDTPSGGGWHGLLESVRVAPEEPALLPGTYFASFPRCRETHLVNVELTERRVHVHCDDPDLPAVLRELSEGE